MRERRNLREKQNRWDEQYGRDQKFEVTVIAVLFVCALSVGSAVFLVLEMDGPFDGLLKASADPMRYAFAHLNQ
jgi:hypothetical protein